MTGNGSSQIDGTTIVLAKERLLAAEQDGKLCRDDSVEALFKFVPQHMK